MTRQSRFLRRYQDSKQRRNLSCQYKLKISVPFNQLGKEDQMYKKILVPLDGSELAECVLPHVESIAKGCGVESVTFVRVAEPAYRLYNSEEGYSLSAKEIESLEAETVA